MGWIGLHANVDKMIFYLYLSLLFFLVLNPKKVNHQTVLWYTFSPYVYSFHDIFSSFILSKYFQTSPIDSYIMLYSSKTCKLYRTGLKLHLLYIGYTVYVLIQQKKQQQPNITAISVALSYTRYPYFQCKNKNRIVTPISNFTQI